MAENWPWESSSRAPTSSAQQISSPLQSGSSQSSHEAAVAAAELEVPHCRPQTLVETLRTCLATTVSASPPEATAAAALVGRSHSDPLRQPLRGSGSKTGMKRRSRASRRVPTTVVEATMSDFRETVHRLTGIPTPAPASAPVRPQPQRASYVRAMQQPAARGPPTPTRPQLLNPQLHITEAPPPMHPAFWPPHSEPAFVKHEAAKEFGAPAQSAPATTVSQLVSGPSGSIQTWWDTALPQPQSQGFVLNPITTGAIDVSGPSAGQILQDDFDDWFHQEHSGSDYMH